MWMTPTRGAQRVVTTLIFSESMLRDFLCTPYSLMVEGKGCGLTLPQLYLGYRERGGPLPPSSIYFEPCLSQPQRNSLIASTVFGQWNLCPFARFDKSFPTFRSVDFIMESVHRGNDDRLAGGCGLNHQTT